MCREGTKYVFTIHLLNCWNCKSTEGSETSQSVCIHFLGHHSPASSNILPHKGAEPVSLVLANADIT
jgi:hypothetical protein